MMRRPPGAKLEIDFRVGTPREKTGWRGQLDRSVLRTLNLNVVIFEAEPPKFRIR